MVSDQPHMGIRLHSVICIIQLVFYMLHLVLAAKKLMMKNQFLLGN